MSSVYVTCCTPKSKPLVTADMFRHKELTYGDDTDHLYSFNAGHHGRITVLDRVTGFTGSPRDIESAFADLYPSL